MRFVCFLFAAVLSAQSQPPAGMIEGQVVSAKTGAPLKRANVHLNGMYGRLPSGPGNNAPPYPVRLSKETDEQGKFSFTGLAGGRYTLSVDRQGYLRTNYGSRTFNTSGTPLVLRADQHMRDLIFKLSPQSVIAGKVLDEDGEPMANVQVRAYRNVYRGASKEWVQAGSGQTNDIGEYRIANLEPRQYLVATAESNSDMSQTFNDEPLPQKPETAYASTYYPNGLDSTAGAPVEVGPGAEVHGIDIRLRKVQVFRVRGVVVNPTGKATATQVMLTVKDILTSVRGMSQARAQDGKFEIRNVTPGLYFASARFSAAGGTPLLATAPVNVAGNHVEGLTLTLSGGVDVAGSVRVAESDAQVTLTNLSVNVRPVGFYMGGSGWGKVGDDLRFVVHNVAPMRFTASISGLPENCFVKSIKYAGQDVTEAGVDLVNGTPLEFVLSATAGSIAGTVADKDGTPVVGAVVALVPKEGGGPYVNARSTDENGGFSFQGLRPGDYKLFAWEDLEEGAHNDPEVQKAWSSRAADVKVDPSGRQSVQLKVISAEETAGKPTGK